MPGAAPRSAGMTSTHAQMPAVGMDLTDVDRLRAMIQRRGMSAVARLFTVQEQQDARRDENEWRWDSLAGRFAAKEAVKKVLASRGYTSSWREIEILRGSHAEPVLRLHGRAQSAAAECGFSCLLLSISHEKGMAAAVVIAV